MGILEQVQVLKDLQYEAQRHQEREQQKSRRKNEKRKAPLPQFSSEDNSGKFLPGQSHTRTLVSRRTMRAPLSRSELAECKQAYDSFGPITCDVDTPESFAIIKDLLLQCGQNPPDEDIQQFFGAYSGEIRRVGRPVAKRCLEFETFVGFMEKCKYKHVKTVSDPHLDTLEAFVAMGGNIDKSGYVETKTIMNSIIHFNLGIDVWHIISKVEQSSKGSVTWPQFCGIFSSIAHRNREKITLGIGQLQTARQQQDSNHQISNSNSSNPNSTQTTPRTSTGGRIFEEAEHDDHSLRSDTSSSDFVGEGDDPDEWAENEMPTTSRTTSSFSHHHIDKPLLSSRSQAGLQNSTSINSIQPSYSRSSSTVTPSRALRKASSSIVTGGRPNTAPIPMRHSVLSSSGRDVRIGSVTVMSGPSTPLSTKSGRKNSAAKPSSPWHAASTVNRGTTLPLVLSSLPLAASVGPNARRSSIASVHSTADAYSVNTDSDEEESYMCNNETSRGAIIQQRLDDIMSGHQVRQEYSASTPFCTELVQQMNDWARAVKKKHKRGTKTRATMMDTRTVRTKNIEITVDER